LSFALILSALCPARAQQDAAANADPALRAAKAGARFRAAYAARYNINAEDVIKELAAAHDPDAAAVLAYIMTTSPSAAFRGDAAYALGKRVKDPAADLSGLRFLKLALKDKDVNVRSSALMAASEVLGFLPRSRFSADYAGAYAVPAAQELLGEAVKDRDRDVQAAAGGLSRSIDHWLNSESPSALKKKAEREKKDYRGYIVALSCVVLVILFRLLMAVA